MLYQPQQPRRPLAMLVRRLLSWRPARHRMDIRELNEHIRADIGAPDAPDGLAPRDRIYLEH